MAYLDSDIKTDDIVEVDIRGKRVKAVVPREHIRVDSPPFARPIIYCKIEEEEAKIDNDRRKKALD